jgi:tripartite-type tricarboxylate transporter receptor subunit TctC
MTDLLGGHVQVVFTGVSNAVEYIKASRVRALAVTTAIRSEALPDVPTVGEFIKDFEASQWYGVGAPRATPVEIIDKLNKEINAGLGAPKIKARLADLGSTTLASSPTAFAKLIAEDADKWGKVIRAANIKAE